MKILHNENIINIAYCKLLFPDHFISKVYQVNLLGHCDTSATSLLRRCVNYFASPPDGATITRQSAYPRNLEKREIIKPLTVVYDNTFSFNGDQQNLGLTIFDMVTVGDHVTKALDLGSQEHRLKLHEVLDISKD